MHLRLTTELCNASGNAVCVPLLLVSMFTELFSHCSRMNTGGHKVMKLVAQDTDEFCGQRFVQNVDRLCAIQRIVLSNSAVFDLLARSISNLLDVFQERHRELLQAI